MQHLVTQDIQDAAAALTCSLELYSIRGFGRRQGPAAAPVTASTPSPPLQRPTYLLYPPHSARMALRTRALIRVPHRRCCTWMVESSLPTRWSTAAPRPTFGVSRSCDQRSC